MTVSPLPPVDADIPIKLLVDPRIEPEGFGDGPGLFRRGDDVWTEEYQQFFLFMQFLSGTEQPTEDGDFT